MIISQSVSMKCNFYFFYHWRNMSNISTILNNHLTNSQSAHESDVSLHWPKEQLSSSLGELRLHAFQSSLHRLKEQLSSFEITGTWHWENSECMNNGQPTALIRIYFQICQFVSGLLCEQTCIRVGLELELEKGLFKEKMKLLRKNFFPQPFLFFLEQSFFWFFVLILFCSFSARIWLKNC